MTQRLGNVSVAQIEEKIAVAIKRRRFSLAYHLACAEPKALPSANAVKLVAYNYATDDRMAVQTALSESADDLLEEVEAVLDKAEQKPSPPGYAALLASAALAPALFVAPGGGLANLLSEVVKSRPLDDDMPALWKLATWTADLSEKGVYPSAELFKEIDALEKWEKEEETTKIEVADWMDNSRRRTVKYAPATTVWQEMIDIWEEDGRSSIGWILDNLRKPLDATNNLDIIRQKIEYWRDHDNQDQEINRIDREYRPHREEIGWGAKDDLKSKITEALEFAEKLIQRKMKAPSGYNEYQVRQGRDLRNFVREQSERAIEDIKKTDLLSTSMAVAIEELISNYASVFRVSVGARDSDKPVLQLRDLTKGWLLLDPEIRFDESGDPVTSLNIGKLIEYVDQNNPDFIGAAIARAQRGDFYGADDAITFAQRSGLLDDKGADNAKKEIDEKRTNMQRSIEEKIKNSNKRLDTAVSQRIISLETCEMYRIDISSVDFNTLDLDEILNRIEGESDEIDKEIDEAKIIESERLYKTLESVKNELTRSGNQISDEDEKQICDAIKHQMFSVAEDYIERIVQGTPLPETKIEEVVWPFDDFFPKFCNDYISFRDELLDAFEQVREAVKNRGKVGPIDCTQLLERDALEGSLLLERWSSLRANGKSAREFLVELFEMIGFEEAKVKKEKKKSSWMLESKPVFNRVICQIPNFGSQAGGSYRLIVIDRAHGPPSVYRIIEEVQESLSSEGAPPNIVLVLDALEEDERRGLPRELEKGECPSTLVLDEVLAVFLATRPFADRLKAFFNCTSAFTFVEPFNPDAHAVPTEMFFGRHSERQAILAMEGGSHFVYGGRRVGKTTLLRNILDHCKEEQEQGKVKWVAEYINLEGTGIGKDANDLWTEIAEKLIKHGVCGSRTFNSNTIERRVKEWLNENEGENPRILLLFDEADNFLKADESQWQSYSVLQKLKALMEYTDRRFKVVFAGLHNVQATVRVPNNPFAHLGDQTLIGPMLPFEEPKEKIEDLIRLPLEALGYRFTLIDSVIRIAAEASYYPVLVQQICRDLLRKLRKDTDIGNQDGPPYEISPDIVDEVLDSKETRDQLSKLFRLTIELEPRYECLAYIIAQMSFETSESHLKSVSIDHIREKALQKWPEGFGSDEPIRFYEIQELLKEMVGLGILRKSEDTEDYAIRSRNLRMLLGDDAEIRRKLEDVTTQKLRPKIDTTSFRYTLGQDEGEPSPITASQEEQILTKTAFRGNQLHYSRNVLGLVFGARLTGLNRVKEALKKIVDMQSRVIDVRMCEVEMANMYEGLRSIHKMGGMDIALIDARDAEWMPKLREAAKLLASLVAQKHTTRPVFLLGPGEAWTWLEETKQRDGRGSLAGGFDVGVEEIWLAPCARDFADGWLRDRETPAGAKLSDPLWPMVAQIAARGKMEKIVDAINATISNTDLVSDVLLGPETKTALKVFVEGDDSMDVGLFCQMQCELAKVPGFIEKNPYFARDPINPEAAQRIFDWGSRLGILRIDQNGHRLDSTYAAGLKEYFKKHFEE